MRWILLVAEVLAVILVMVFFPAWAAIPVIALTTVAFFLTLIWFFLAPSNIFFTFVNEGSAKVVVRGGQVREVLIQVKGFTVDRNQEWEVVRGHERYPFGGLRWVGIWPLDDIYIYQFQWTNVLHNGKILVHSPEWLDYILLKEDIYFFALTEIEDAELLHLEVHVLLTLRVTNPYKALFRVQDWLETIINRFKPLVRDRIAQDSYRTLVPQKGSMGGELFDASDILRQEFKNRYGIEVLAVEVKEINPPEDFRDETLRKWSAEREAEQIGVLAEATADQIDKEYSAVRRHGLSGLLIRLFGPKKQE